MKWLFAFCMIVASYTNAIHIVLEAKTEIEVSTLAESPINIIPHKGTINFSQNIGNICENVDFLQFDFILNTTHRTFAHAWDHSLEGFYVNNVYGNCFYCHQDNADLMHQKAQKLRRKRMARPYALQPEEENIIYGFSFDGKWIANGKQHSGEVKLFYGPFGCEEQVSLKLAQEDGGLVALAFLENPTEQHLVVIAEKTTSLYKINLGGE